MQVMSLEKKEKGQMLHFTTGPSLLLSATLVPQKRGRGLPVIACMLGRTPGNCFMVELCKWRDDGSKYESILGAQQVSNSQ